MNTLLRIVAVAFFISIVSIGSLQASARSDCEDAGCRYTRESGTWSCNCD